MAGLIPLNAALNGPTISRQNLLFAFPQFTEANTNINNLPIGKQRYDSFQLKATKRFSLGLTFLASYTVAKTLEQVNLLNRQDLFCVTRRRATHQTSPPTKSIFHRNLI